MYSQSRLLRCLLRERCADEELNKGLIVNKRCNDSNALMRMCMFRWSQISEGVLYYFWHLKKQRTLRLWLTLLVEAPFFRYYGYGWQPFQNVPLGSVGTFVDEHRTSCSAAFADDLFSLKLVSNFLSYQLIFPSSQRFFKTLTVRFKSSLRSLAISKVSASLCSFK